MLDLLNFDDSKLQMHRFTAVALEATKITSQGLLQSEEDILVHQNQLARVNCSEYRSVFGLKHSQECSEIKLVHVAAREQHRNESRLVGKLPNSDLNPYGRRRSNRRELTPTELPSL